MPLDGKPCSKKHRRFSQFVTKGSVMSSFFNTSVKGSCRLFTIVYKQNIKTDVSLGSVDSTIIHTLGNARQGVGVI